MYYLRFSNEDIFKFIIEPLKGNPQFELYPVDTDDNLVMRGSDIPIAAVFLYGFDTEPYINFHEYKTVIYLENANFTNWQGLAYSVDDKKTVYHSGCDAFMFVDDEYKQVINIDETYGRVVYGGNLRDKTHEDILKLILRFVLLITSAKKIEIEGGIVCKVSFIDNDGNRNEVDPDEFEFICM